jgi:sporulation protein YlmC with PRC-barrel domain
MPLPLMVHIMHLCPEERTAAREVRAVVSRVKGGTMRYINDLLGKQVINQASGERMAPVRDVVLSGDMRAIVALLIGGGLFHDDRVVRWQAIQSLGDVIVVDAGQPLLPVRDDDAVAALHREAFQLTGLAVITAAGERVGTVADTAFDGGGRVLGFVLKHGVLEGRSGATFVPVESAQTIGRAAVIVAHADLPTVRAFEEAAAAGFSSDDLRARERG